MAEKCREIQMFYSHDRLGDEKISQIYRMLVPEKIWKNRVAQGDTHEDSGTLCTGIVGEAKRGTDDRGARLILPANLHENMIGCCSIIDHW